MAFLLEEIDNEMGKIHKNNENQDTNSNKEEL
jgi:hypothetical protein